MAVLRADVMEYVGIEADYADNQQKAGIDRALKTAELWLKGAVGKDVDLDDPRAEELVLMAAGEMFETRCLTDDRLSKYAGAKTLASLNRMAGDLILQLKYSESFEEADAE